MKLTDATKAEIRKAAHNEGHLAQGVAEHTIWLLENQRAEWFAEPERTPEVVLRAMLAAYERAALEAAILRFGNKEARALVAALNADERVMHMRDACAAHIAGDEAGGLRRLQRWGLRADYEARLSGARPLNAPPMEV